MVSKSLFVLVLLGLMGLSSVVVAEEMAAATAAGTVSSVAADGKSFVLAVPGEGEATMVTVTVTETTKYTLNGEASTMDKVVVKGQAVTVLHKDATAISVAAVTK